MLELLAYLRANGFKTFIVSGAGKPVGIQMHIGRRPIAAFGNSDGRRVGMLKASRLLPAMAAAAPCLVFAAPAPTAGPTVASASTRCGRATLDRLA